MIANVCDRDVYRDEACSNVIIVMSRPGLVGELNEALYAIVLGLEGIVRGAVRSVIASRMNYLFVCLFIICVKSVERIRSIQDSPIKEGRRGDDEFLLGLRGTGRQ